MMSMTRHALARSATISAGAAIAVPRKTRLACSSMAALQHSRLGAVAYGRICPVHVWPVLRCPPRSGKTPLNARNLQMVGRWSRSDELTRSPLITRDARLDPHHAMLPPDG